MNGQESVTATDSHEPLDQLSELSDPNHCTGKWGGGGGGGGEGFVSDKNINT